MRIKLDLPNPLFHALQTRSAVRGITVQALVTEFVERGLGAPELPVQRKRSPLPIARRAAGQSTPSLTNAELHQILDTEDAQRQIESNR